jgi:hypothetical protein
VSCINASRRQVPRLQVFGSATPAQLDQCSTDHATCNKVVVMVIVTVLYLAPKDPHQGSPLAAHDVVRPKLQLQLQPCHNHNHTQQTRHHKHTYNHDPSPHPRPPRGPPAHPDPHLLDPFRPDKPHFRLNSPAQRPTHIDAAERRRQSRANHLLERVVVRDVSHRQAACARAD